MGKDAERGLDWVGLRVIATAARLLVLVRGAGLPSRCQPECGDPGVPEEPSRKGCRTWASAIHQAAAKPPRGRPVTARRRRRPSVSR